MRPQKPAPAMYGSLSLDDIQMVLVLRGGTISLDQLADRFRIDKERAKHLALALLDEGTIGPVISKQDPSGNEYTVIAKLADLVA